MDDGRPIAEYLLDNWHWNSAKFRVEGIPLSDLIENLTRVRFLLRTSATSSSH